MKITGERFIPDASLLQDEMGYEHLHRYYSIIPLIKGKAVLDIACGEGYGSAILAAHAQSVTGADIDQTSIDEANQKYTSADLPLSFVQADAALMPFADDSFDVVVSFETIEHLDAPAQQQFMQGVKKVLRE
ncbi:MAG TPA: class I SAM-dependent methyltransferase, partial [Chitinophagaceae bacterium]|nr:class I SAM-dependent methyltransferase [Chitinophagaceae bacterium]